MIIIRYLIRETLKSQLAILFILFLIFFCQKLVRVLSAAMEGSIPSSLVFSLLGLGVAEMAQLILPLSLFLAILLTYSRLYAESEITVMHACGLGKSVLLKVAGILALITSALAVGNAFWLSPWSARHQDEVRAEAKANPGVAALIEGRFKPTSDGNSVLFVGKVDGAQFSDVFLAQLRTRDDRRPSVIVASKGHITVRKDGSQVVTLDKGSRFEGTALLRDFRITDFTNYQAVIGYQPIQADSTDAEQQTAATLWHSRQNAYRAELSWRITQIVSVLLMAFIAVPLSEVNPRQGRMLSMLPALLLYLIYFLLQSSLKSNGARGKLDPTLWMALIDGIYLVLALLLNAWDTVPMRRLRNALRFRGGR